MESILRYNDSMLEDLPVELGPLRMLVAVATCGTVTEAARRLHLSQPAATHQIRQLEGRLGIELFERRSRGLFLTEAGRVIVERARRILAELEGLKSDLKALQGLETGQIRLGGGATATVHLLPKIIATFRARHPGVSFYVREGSSAPILEAVSNGDLDLAIVMMPCDRPGLVSIPLLEEPILFVGWPGSPLAGRPFPKSRLSGAPFIHAGADFPLRAAVQDALVRADITPQVVMELQSVEAIKAHVEEGLGYSALGAYALKREIEEGRLVVLSPKGISLKRELGLVQRAHVPLSPAVAAFVRLLSESLAAIDFHLALTL